MNSVTKYKNIFSGNAGCMLGPKKVDVSLQEAAGTIIVASLVLGNHIASTIYTGCLIISHQLYSRVSDPHVFARSGSGFA